MKRIFKIFLLLSMTLIFGFSFAITGCSATRQAAFVTSIEYSGSDSLTDIYTVYYSDGTTSSFTVKNGANGADGNDGADVSITEIYEKYCDEYGYIAYSEFLDKYLTFNAGTTELTVGEDLQSSMVVYTEFIESSYLFIRPGMTTTVSDTAMFTGSAVIWSIDEDYTYIVTNYHVVYDSSADVSKNGGTNIARKITCYMYGSEGSPVSIGTGVDGYTAYDYGNYAVECEFVGGSVNADIAIIRAKTSELKNVNENFRAVTLADDYYVGETAIAIGNTEGLGISVTQGIVSVESEYITLNIDGTSRYYRSLRIDTAIYSGNSGGGLFNSDGKLIGITNAGNTSDQNINYAIPLEIVKGTVNNILYYFNDGDVTTNGAYKITLGVNVNTCNSKFVYDSSLGYGKIHEDVVIVSVVESSIAEKLGIAADDVITAVNVNGERYEIIRSYEIYDFLVNIRSGDSITVDYIRNGENQTTSAYTVTASDLANF